MGDISNEVLSLLIWLRCTFVTFLSDQQFLFQFTNNNIALMTSVTFPSKNVNKFNIIIFLIQNCCCYSQVSVMVIVIQCAIKQLALWRHMIYTGDSSPDMIIYCKCSLISLLSTWHGLSLSKNINNSLILRGKRLIFIVTVHIPCDKKHIACHTPFPTIV